MAKIALRVDQMNRKAVIFNTANVAGDIVYYATKIDHIADFGGQTKAVPGVAGATLITAHDIYLDPTNSKGDGKTYASADDWKSKKSTKWTIQKGDYLLSLNLSESYPSISYTTELTEDQFSAVKNTMHIAEISETIYKDGEVCLITLTMDA